MSSNITFYISYFHHRRIQQKFLVFPYMVNRHQNLRSHQTYITPFWLFYDYLPWIIKKKQYYKFPCSNSQFQNVIHTKIISSIFVYLFLNLLYLDKSYTHQIVLFISFYLCERVRVRFDCFGSIVLDYPSRRFSLQAFYVSLMAKNLFEFNTS